MGDLAGRAHPWRSTRRLTGDLCASNAPAEQEAFGGGHSVAYVFLHLIPSLGAFDHDVGPRIHFIALLGFVIFYGLDVWFQPSRDTHPTKYYAYLGVFFLYDGLLVFTLGLELPPTPTRESGFDIGSQDAPDGLREPLSRPSHV